jgi:exopolysaccharide production protein ExoQ
MQAVADLQASTVDLPRGSHSLGQPSRLRLLLVDALIVFFFLAGIYAFTPIKDNLVDVERIAWLAADGAVVLLLLAQPGPFVTAFRQNLVMFSWPILAIFSCLWSIAPSPTLYFAVQLLMTVVVGTYLCLYADLSHLLKLLFFALLISAFLSVVLVVINPAAAFFYGGELKGVFPHKNVLGHVMALMIFTSLCLFLQGWRRVLTGFATIFALALLFLSRSGVGMVAVAVALVIIPLAVAIRAGPVALALVAGFGAAVVAAGALGAEVASVDLMENALDALGKDSTLTGRTVLWEMGAEAFYSRWWLGYGFKGFWADPVTSEQLRFVFGQDIPYFHNNYVEVAVAFGIWGPLVLGAGLLVAFVRAARAYLSDTQFVKVWPVTYLVFVLVLTYVENPLFANHNIHQLLFVLAMVAPVTHEHWRRSEG